MRRIVIDPTGIPSRISGTASPVRMPKRRALRQTFRPVLFALGPEVVNMNCLPVEYSAAARGTTANRSGFADCKPGRDKPIARHLPHHVIFDAIDLSINGLT